jgi:Agrobacterium tumefaciens protein Atu4866
MAGLSDGPAITSFASNGRIRMNEATLPAAQGSTRDNPQPAHPYVGMRVMADNYIRHALRADGRWAEARGRGRSAYQGSYRMEGITSSTWTIPVPRRTAISAMACRITQRWCFTGGEADIGSSCPGAACGDAGATGTR